MPPTPSNAFFDEPEVHADRSEVLLSVISGTVASRTSQLQNMLESLRAPLRAIDHEIVVSISGSFPDDDETWATWACHCGDVAPRWVSSPVRDGAVRAFNDAFAVSRGKYILTLNDDVRVDPAHADIQKAIDLLEVDPLIGQVAFAHSGPATRSPIQTIHGKPYLNYGLTRASVARQIAKICGGFWCPIYWTYGADCELSAWVWRLGFKVVPCMDVVVLDDHANDDLRSTNTGKAPADGKNFHCRWHSWGTLNPGGTLPAVDDATLERLALYGDTPPKEVALASSEAAPPPSFPARDDRALSGMRVVNVYVAWGEEPQAALRTAIDRSAEQSMHLTVGAPYTTELGVQYARDLLGECANLAPHLILIQCQWPEVLPQELLGQLKADARRLNYSPRIVLWSGDVAGRNSHTRFSWYAELGRQVDHTLHTSKTHVRALQAAGVSNAAYWQIGFDDHLYNPGAQAAYGDLYDTVFLFNRYGRDLVLSLPEQTAWTRETIAKLLLQARRSNTALRFYAGGNIRPSLSADAYQRSLSAINVSISDSLDSYSSDRLLRILGSGTACLTQVFPGMEIWGLQDGINCITFRTASECISIVKEIATHEPSVLARIRSIGRAGATLAHTQHTWGVRLCELRAILEGGGST